MTIYVVIRNDRHVDTEVFLFSTPEKAIEFAKASAYEYRCGKAGVDETLEPPMQMAGWLYHAYCGSGDDCVWVVPCEIDAGDPPYDIGAYEP